MVKKITVAIVDEYKILREALVSMLSKHDDVEIVGEAADGFRAIQIAKEINPDVLILEPLLPKKDGIDVTKEIKAMENGTSVLILTMDNTHHAAFRMLRAGAMGWMSKNVGSPDVYKAIQCVGTGKIYLPEDLQREFAEKYVHPEKIHRPEDQLSDREYQVLRLLAMGNTNREIAESLFVGVKTIDTHRANLLRKLGLRNNSDLTRFAIQAGIIKF